MVGGKVVETILLDDQVWINCQGTRSEANQQCAIYVERDALAECVEPGDSLWWQMEHAYWTPAGRESKDYRIKRIGYSGAPRPIAR